MAFDDICMSCLEEKGVAWVCSRCGCDEERVMTPLALPLRTELNQQYLIGRVLGVPGGYAITYLAWDIRLSTPVAIKEYQPRGLVERAPDGLTVLPQSRENEEPFRKGLLQFLNEAHLLAQLGQLNHPNIIRVRSLFEANGTGYMVMDYYRGKDLQELFKQQGPLSPTTARWLLMPILDGLHEIHERRILHRDVKPANIYLTERKQPVLLDFGAARVMSEGPSQGLADVRTPGYSPYEQEVGGKQGPWTDIYACGATLYFLLSGRYPLPAVERKKHDTLVSLEQLVPNISPSLSDAVRQALAVEWEHRPQDVRTFQALLTRDAQLTTSAPTRQPTVASLVVTRPQCRVTNRISVGCSYEKSRSPSFSCFDKLIRKGLSIAAIVAVLVLLLGANVWA